MAMPQYKKCAPKESKSRQFLANLQDCSARNPAITKGLKRQAPNPSGADKSIAVNDDGVETHR